MRIDGVTERGRALTAAAAAVRRGDLVLIPTERVYALAADAFRGTTALREAKGQDAHVALPVLVASQAMVQGIAQVRPLAADVMSAFWPGELTIILPAQPTLAWDASAGGPVAVRMPLHPFTLALVTLTGPLAVTAAKRGAEAEPVDVDLALDHFGADVSVAVDVGPLPGQGSSTVLDLTAAMPRVVRRGAVSADDLRVVCPQLDLDA
jgi:L-threonylcarbamoyladenylate synthase